MYDLITGTGINGTNHPAVQPFWPPEILTPDTWTNTSGAYNDEWQSRGLLDLATQDKIGWIIFDMVETQHLLNELYMWNGRQPTGGNADIRSFNLYYATSPSNAIPVPPTANGVTVNYDFASGGWTLLNTGAPSTSRSTAAARPKPS